MAPKIENTVPGVPVGEFVEEHLVQAQYDEDGVQSLAAIGKDGKEYGDPVPMHPPVGYNNPPDLSQMIRRMVQHELSDLADAQGFDSFEDGDDFEVPDEDPMDRNSPYEHNFDPPVTPPAAGPQTPAQPAPSPSQSTEGGGAAGGSPNQAPPAPPADRPLSTT